MLTKSPTVSSAVHTLTWPHRPSLRRCVEKLHSSNTRAMNFVESCIRRKLTPVRL